MVLLGSSSPLSVTRTPPVRVVEPVLPLAAALQVLSIAAAVRTSWAEVFTVLTLAELVTVPPGVPAVLTSIGPEEKNLAGPALAAPVAAVAVNGVAEPPAGRVTVGSGPMGSWGPPKRLTVREYPKAPPLTSPDWAPDGDPGASITAVVANTATANAERFLRIPDQ